MPQSLSFLLVHLVFSTKDRQPFLDVSIQSELYAYLATVIRNMKCECYRVNGVADHVHLAIRLSRTVSVAELVETLKSSSSKWLQKQSPKLEKFTWQRGYGVFSVDPRKLNSLTDYINGQEEHHRKVTFQDELRTFLRTYGVKFDEQYLWD